MPRGIYVRSKKQLLKLKKWGYANRTHGLRKTKFYYVFHNIQKRCNNPSADNFPRYGGRGIKYLWKNFEEFRDDMYKSYQGHVKKFGAKQTQIDRIDNNGNYCKKNCRWVTIKEQAKNKRNNIKITYKRKTLILSDWAMATGIYRKTLSRRLSLKWPIEKILTTPPQVGRNQFS